MHSADAEFAHTSQGHLLRDKRMQPVVVVRAKRIEGVTMTGGQSQEGSGDMLSSEALVRLCLVFPMRDIGRRRRDYGVPTLSRTDGM